MPELARSEVLRMTEYAVEFLNVTYQYHDQAQSAICNINLKIPKGEFLLITGASGSGKSSLAKCINGLIPHFHEGDFKGCVKLLGSDTAQTNISRIGEWVGSVFQDLKSQFFMTDTTSEVAFGCSHMGISREEVWKRTENSFCHMNIKKLKDRSIFTLSSGEMQKVAVASCYAMQPEIYVFDEPSANLDLQAIKDLAVIMAQLKKEKKTVIVLEHRLFYLTTLFDRMLFMENGKIVSEYSNEAANQLTNTQLMEMGLRNFCLETLDPDKQDNLVSSSTVKLELKNIAFTYQDRKLHTEKSVLEHLHLKAGGGELVGVVGENGAGKTTLARLCCGLLKESAGEVLLNEKAVTHKKRIGELYFVMQDSDFQLFSDSVWNELSIGHPKNSMDTAKHKGILEMLHLLDLKDAHPASLSRGQKQRVTIASALAGDSEILFFDEPTSGLDRWNMTCVAQELKTLAANGKLVFVITHDYEFLLSACTRIVCLENHKIKEDFPLNQKTKDKLANILLKGGGAFA